jgi:putative zinc finger/helix-turn-helix YgiT family protein
MFTLRKGRICPVCEKGKLQVKNKDLLFAYMNRAKKIPNQKVFACNVCDYEGLTDIDNEKIEKSLADFRRVIDGLLPCDTLKSIRKELGLNKKSMAKLLSVNEKTVGRYENGKVTQSAQVNKLYRVLQATPFLARIIEPNIPFIDPGFQSRVIPVKKGNYNPEPANGYHYQTDVHDDRITVNAT